MNRNNRAPVGTITIFANSFALGTYFTFAAVQGDYGLFRRAEIEAEARDMSEQLRRVQADVAQMENLTRRLSDEFLDLDLLDEQARDVLGLIRHDEIVVR